MIARLPVCFAVSAAFVIIVPLTGAQETPKTKPARPGATKPRNPPLPQVNINTATAEELQTLPAVGPQYAEVIIKGRPYTSIDQLERVGVPASVIVGFRKQATLKGPTTAVPKPKPAPNEALAAVPPADPININTATHAQLEELPGVTAALAGAIIDHRPYQSIDDLKQVPGLSAAKLAALRLHLAVDEPATPAPATQRLAINPAPAPTPAVAKVDLNTASQTDLETLPGIGAARAQAIIAGRPYARIEDVMKVPGIKQGLFDKIKDRVEVK